MKRVHRVGVATVLGLLGCGEARIEHNRGCPQLERVYVTKSGNRGLELEDLRGFTHVAGDLEVGSKAIDPLECLEVVSGELSITGGALMDDRLPALRQVGVLTIGNPLAVFDGVGGSHDLTDLEGLPSLEVITRGLTLVDLPNLDDLSALDGVLLDGSIVINDVSPRGTLAVRVPERLYGGLGLYGSIPDVSPTTAGLRWVADDVVVVGEALARVDLSGLEQVDGVLRLSSLPSDDLLEPPDVVEILGLPAFPRLRTVGEALSIEAVVTPDLRELAALQDVGSLSVTRCEGLTSLDGLQSLRSIEPMFGDPSSLSIGENPALLSLARLGELDAESGPRTIAVFDNALLASVDGLGALFGQATAVELRDLPALRSLAGLGHHPALPNIVVRRTGLRSLDGLDFSETRLGAGNGQDALALADNPAFEDLTALIEGARAGLQPADGISFSRLPALTCSQVETLVTALAEQGIVGIVRHSSIGSDGPCEPG